MSPIHSHWALPEPVSHYRRAIVSPRTAGIISLSTVPHSAQALDTEQAHWGCGPGWAENYLGDFESFISVSTSSSKKWECWKWFVRFPQAL